MTRTTFKEKSMKKGSMVTKEAVNRQHQYLGRPSHTHNPPNNFAHQKLNQKGGCTRLLKEQQHMYMPFQLKLVYVHDCSTKTRVYKENCGKK